MSIISEEKPVFEALVMFVNKIQKLCFHLETLMIALIIILKLASGTGNVS